MSASTSSSFSDDDAVLSDINVTPLVDVVLVLLIVFMITVPAIVGTAPIKVDLPETKSVQRALEPELLPIDVSVRREPSGEIGLYLNEALVTPEQLKQKIQTLGANPKEQPVKISADKGLAYGEVVKVMDLLASIGLNKMALDTKPVAGK